jgi:hypothetical protein
VNSVVCKPAKTAVTTALLAADFVTLPIKPDLPHPVGFTAALARSQHDSRGPANHSTYNTGHGHEHEPFPGEE